MQSLRPRPTICGSRLLPILAPSLLISQTRHLSCFRQQQQQQCLKTSNTTESSLGDRKITYIAPNHRSNSRKSIKSGATSLNYLLGSKFSIKSLQNGVANQNSYSTAAKLVTKPIIHDLFEEVTGTWQFIVADPSTLNAVVIDPVLDYDRATQIMTTRSADTLLSLIKDKGYKIEMILETHAHADHLTAASYLQHCLAQEQGYRPSIGIGKRIKQVQEKFGKRYGIPVEEYEGVFDKLLDDDEKIKIGSLIITALHLPGHTPDHLGYKIDGS
jgi:hypothetical protein